VAGEARNFAKWQAELAKFAVENCGHYSLDIDCLNSHSPAVTLSCQMIQTIQWEDNQFYYETVTDW